MQAGDTLKEEIHFRIESRIDSGTYGVVYKGRQEGVDRVVAIKELQKPNPEQLKNETWIQGRLIHPNIVTVLLFDEVQGYIVMEYVEASLKTKLISYSQKKLLFETDRVISILKGCLEALAFAHEHGCLHHGDIKPGNILLADGWQVKLSDFGVAQSYRTGPSSQEGSESWAAPETLKAWNEHHLWSGNEQSDLFSLGVVIYLLLAGKNPFVDQKGIQKPSDLILDPDYVPELPATVKPELSRIVAKLLAKDTKDRYHSAREVLDDLYESTQESGGALASPPPPPPSSPSPPATPTEPKPTKELLSTMSADQLARIAFALNSNGDFADAEDYSTAAIKKDSKFAAAYHTRGFSRSRLGNLKEAIRDFDEALSLTPAYDLNKLGQILYMRAFAERRLGDNSSACADIRRAIEYDPLNEKYQYLRSRVCAD